MKEAEALIAAVCLACLCFILGAAIFSNGTTGNAVNRAIKAEKAYYHPQTGVITWSDNITKFIVTGEQ